jgi:hypothetical protein
VKQFLLIQKRSPFSDYVETFLKPHAEIVLSHAESISQALTAIEKNSEFDCIFIGHSIIVDAEVKQLTEKLKNYLKIHTSCKILGSNKGLSEQDWVKYIPSMSPPIKIFEAIQTSLGIKLEPQVGGYIPIPIFSLKYFILAPCDVYFKIGSNHEATFVKRFKESDTLDAKEIQKYADKEVKEMFVPASRVKEVTDAIASQLAKKSNYQELNKGIETVVDALDYASFILKTFGIKTEEQAIIKKVLDNISISLEKGDKSKGSKIESILKSKDDYFFKHVALTALLSNMLMNELRWEFSSELKTAIVYASFFQNFFITSEDEIACLDEISMNFVKDKEARERLRDHAKLAFDFIREMKDVSYDAQRLVLEQHGSKFGIGYPEKKANTNQLSSLFMIANEFAVHFLTAFESHPPREMRPVLQSAKVIYGKQNLKIIEALETCITRMSLNASFVRK